LSITLFISIIAFNYFFEAIKMAKKTSENEASMEKLLDKQPDNETSPGEASTISATVTTVNELNKPTSPSALSLDTTTSAPFKRKFLIVKLRELNNSISDDKGKRFLFDQIPPISPSAEQPSPVLPSPFLAKKGILESSHWNFDNLSTQSELVDKKEKPDTNLILMQSNNFDKNSNYKKNPASISNASASVNASHKNLATSEDDDVFSDSPLSKFTSEQEKLRESEGEDTITSLSNNIYKQQLEKIKRKASLKSTSAHINNLTANSGNVQNEFR
jgi:hypothetical protein